MSIIKSQARRELERWYRENNYGHAVLSDEQQKELDDALARHNFREAVKDLIENDEEVRALIVKVTSANPDSQ